MTPASPTQNASISRTPPRSRLTSASAAKSSEVRPVSTIRPDVAATIEASATPARWAHSHGAIAAASSSSAPAAPSAPTAGSRSMVAIVRGAPRAGPLARSPDGASATRTPAAAPSASPARTRTFVGP